MRGARQLWQVSNRNNGHAGIATLTTAPAAAGTDWAAEDTPRTDWVAADTQGTQPVAAGSQDRALAAVVRKDTREAAHTDCMRGVAVRRDSLVEGRTGWGSLEGSRDRVLGVAAWPGGVAEAVEAVAVARLVAVVKRQAVPLLLMPRAAVLLRPARRAAPAVRKTTTPR